MSESGHGDLPVVDHVDVGLVEDEKEIVLLGDADDPLERFLVIDKTRGVVGVDDENPHDGLVVLHLHLQLVHVRVPLVIGVHPVRVGRKRGVEHLGKEMRRIGRLREDHPGVHADRAVAARNGIAKPVEKQDVVRGDLRLAALVHQPGQELPRLVHPLRGGVAKRLVVLDDLDEDVLHPLRNLLALLDGVPDVLPGHFHAAGLETVCHPDDVADFVGEPVSSLGDVESHKYPLPAPRGATLMKRQVTVLFLRVRIRNPMSKQPIPQGKCKLFWSFNTIERKFLLKFSSSGFRGSGRRESPRCGRLKASAGEDDIRVEISPCLV